MARGRGGRGGGRSRGDLPREVQISKKLSWLLRHGAEQEGLKLGPGGYLNVQDVLNSQKIRSFKVTMPELAELVCSNEKQRFSLIPASKEPAESSQDTAEGLAATTAALSVTDSSKPSDYLIRANQGHSIKIDTEGLATPLSLEQPESLPRTVVHGTNRAAWPLIVSNGGLKPMARNHVHFATGLPQGFTTMAESSASTESTRSEQTSEPPVISGMRHASSILVFLDLEKAMKSGLKFWRSDNGVILTDGGEKGIVPLEFFARVEERGTSGSILVQDGVVLRNI